LVGQIPAYASYIAIGCGAKPVADTKLEIESAVLSGNVATLTIPNHHFVSGSPIKVENLNSVLNGSYTVSAVGADTVSYSCPGTNIASFTPAVPGYAFFDYSNKENLDFEMFRVPISSRGFVNENGVSKIVFTAAMPTEERYEITEVGVYSAGSNPVAGIYDSKAIYSFGKNENWEFHNSTGTVSTVKTVYKPLNYETTTDTITGAYPSNYFNEYSGTGGSETPIETPVFKTNADNVVFSTEERILKNERPRFFNDAVLMRGNTSFMTKEVSIISATSSGTVITYETEHPHLLSAGEVVTISGTLNSNYNQADAIVTEVVDSTKFKIAKTVTAGTIAAGGSTTTTHFIVNDNSSHIHMTGVSLDLDKNSASDELRLAFSVMNKEGSVDHPDVVRLLVEFASTDVHNVGQYARFEAEVINGVTHDLVNNRYVTVSVPLEELHRSSGFTWASIDVVKVYASTIKVVDDVEESSGDFYVALDAFRLENVGSTSAVYGMSGYSVISSPGAKPIVKLANTTNFVEFRFSLDVE
jgi:cytochrome c-type biogenesis protein CcmE